jgi:hypothetical protein
VFICRQPVGIFTLKDAVLNLRKFFPEETAAIVVVATGKELPHVVTPATGRREGAEQRGQRLRGLAVR